MQVTWKPLDKTDTELYKGIAIIMIVIHNFMHLFPEPKENEFSFSPDRFTKLIELLTFEPENFIRILFSYFGHYGVQIFIFLSAYGLTKKYINTPLKYRIFVVERLSKLYVPFVLAIFAWASLGVMEYGLLGPLKVIYWSYESLFLKLLLVSNFFPGEALNPVGPWWFIPFIGQFYLIYPLLLFLYRAFGFSSMLIVSACSYLIVLIDFEFNYYFTVIGHLPEFCLGIYLARADKDGIKIPFYLIILALSFFAAGNYIELLWHFSHLSFLIVLLVIFKVLANAIKNINIINSATSFIGMLSMYIFLVNGFLRKPFITLAIEHNYWLLTIFLCFIFIMISVVLSFVLFQLEGFIKPKVVTIAGDLKALK